MGCCVLPLFALTPKNKMMKELDVKKVSMANIPVEAVPALLDEEKVAFQPVNTVNWTTYPYCPDVKFRIAYTDNAILIHYKVKEASVRAVAGKDNGPVWEDACVEFFSIPAGDGVYYNMECNCVGRLLIGAGAGRSNRQHAPQEVLDKVQRWSSLGQKDFEERISCRLLISCHGIPLIWKSRTSIVRNFSGCCVSSRYEGYNTLNSNKAGI